MQIFRFSSKEPSINSGSTDPELKFAQCFNIWPSFMDAQIPGQKNTLGTPAIDAFDAAAELAAAYVADEIEDSGRTATYWEVKNESDIQHEWTYHLLPQFDGWGLLGDFHNRVAQCAEKSRPNDPSGWPRLGLATYGNGPPIIRRLGKSQAIHGFNPSGLRFLLTSFLRSGCSF